MAQSTTVSDAARAGQLLREGRLAEALPILEGLAESHRRDLDFQKAIADAYLAAGNPAKASEHLRSAMLLSARGDVVVMEKLAYALQQAGEKEKALAQFAATWDAGVRGAPFTRAYAEAMHAYCRAAAPRGFAETERSLRRLARDYPRDAAILSGLADVLIGGGKADEAVAVAKRAYALDPANALIVLVGILINGGRPFEVFPLLAPYGRASLDGPLGDVGRMLAGVLALENEEDVLARLEKLALATPADPFVRLQLMLACFRAGRVSRAGELLADFDPQARRSATILELEARLALLSGDGNGAVNTLHRIWDGVAAAHQPPPAPRPPPRPAARAPEPVVYFPIEIAQREMQARVLTAIYLATRGISSVIAAARTLAEAADSLPPGIVLLKTLNSLDRFKIEKSAPAGHLFAALDEEAMAWTGENWELLCGVDSHIVGLLDLICVTGPRHQEAYAALFPQAREKVRVTGNPRIDLLSSRAVAGESSDIVGGYKDFILVCTNFAATNSALFGYRRACEFFLEVTAAIPGSSSFAQIVGMGRSAAESECAYFRLLMDVLPAIAAAFPEKTFVVRAHPGESDGIWRTVFKDIANVVIDSRGPLHAWLTQAKALIYMSGCTTGLESYLAGVPAVRLAKDPELQFPRYGLSHRLNLPARDSAEAVAALKGVLGGEIHAPSAEERALLDAHISRTAAPAAEKMAEAVFELLTARGGRPGSGTAPTVPAIQAAIKAAIKRGHEVVVRESRRDLLAAAKQVKISAAGTQALAASLASEFGVGADFDVEALADDAVLFIAKPR